jgi:hypothetical protein
MPRGKLSRDGDTNVSANGYHYTRKEGRWRLTHHLVAEEKLGRALASEEMVRFIDGDKTNLHTDNIEVIVKRQASKAKRAAAIRAQISELTAQLEALEAELI